MKLNTQSHRMIAGLLLVTLATSAFAPSAFAGQGGGGQKYRRGGYGYARGGGYSPQVVVERRSSSAGPAIAGFIGGLAVGTILSNRNDCDRQGYDDRGYDRGYGRGVSYRATVEVGDRCAGSAYYYEDPWNGDRYNSLGAFRSACRQHWPIARVIDARTGECVQTVCWHDGGWHDYDASDPPWERSCNRGYDRGRHQAYNGDEDD